MAKLASIGPTRVFSGGAPAVSPLLACERSITCPSRVQAKLAMPSYVAADFAHTTCSCLLERTPSCELWKAAQSDWQFAGLKKRERRPCICGRPTSLVFCITREQPQDGEAICLRCVHTLFKDNTPLRQAAALALFDHLAKQAAQPSPKAKKARKPAKPQLFDKSKSLHTYESAAKRLLQSQVRDWDQAVWPEAQKLWSLLGVRRPGDSPWKCPCGQDATYRVGSQGALFDTCGACFAELFHERPELLRQAERMRAHLE
eukprot:m.283014 g.283014  ORF g.283014 m.283014 type:complete len:259 (+) comp11117_c0_seq1:554-1330(+)